MTEIDGWPPVRVSALFDGRLSRDLAEFAPTHVVSLIDPDLAVERHPVVPASAAWLLRPFYDVHTPQDEAADAAIVADLIDFLTRWRTQASARLLVHCHMGASRSTAVAYLALAIAARARSEADAFARLLAITVKPWPNRLVIALADDLLGRGGALLAPLDAYRDQFAKRPLAYRRLNRQRGLY